MNLFTIKYPYSLVLSAVAKIYKNIKNNKSPGHKYMLVLIGIFSAHPVHLWLVDDDEEDCAMFMDAINELNPNITVSTSHNGEDFFKQLGNMPDSKLPSIIFLDLNLPMINGKDCLEKLKNDSRTSNIPVVIYSTSSHTIDIEDTYNKGAAHYLPKPNSFGVLQQLVGKVLSIEWKKISKPSFEKFVIKL